MKQFIAIVHKDADSSYGVQFPDLPGCFSGSDSYMQIMPNAVEALSLFLDGEDIPTPKPLEQIRNEVAEDLRDGAFLMAVPLVSLTGRTTRVNFTLDTGLLRAIDATAELRGLTRSAFLADLARREIHIS